ncbi:hypothetical protein ABT369_03765 [Dactylosporangium sp. NPDC000244]|uniref:hypothetical protein n=1 Tax=Dactylosporangium sp. NPDC000244 TaxID=3154365 RepID=UPI00331B0EF3
MLEFMYGFARLAGFFAAHGVWSVSEGGPLTPILGYEEASGQRGLTRFVADDLAEGARKGREALESNMEGWARAVLVLDAYIHLEAGKVDALIAEAVEYGPVRKKLVIAVPYRPEPFAVYRPKFLEIEGVSESEAGNLADAFFNGVDSHEEANAVWNAHLDESI